MLPSSVLALALVVGTAGASTAAEPAEAPAEPATIPDDPQALASAAERAFAEGRFEDVVELAARAHALTGDPRHLYAQALAERRLEHCREALILYARVLASVQDDPAFAALVADTRQGIKLCEDTLEAEPAATVEPEPTPSPTEPEPTPPSVEPTPADRGPRPWYRDPWGGVMLGLGLGVAGGAGGTLWGLSVREARGLGSAPDELAYAEGLADAQALRTGAIASVAVGSALLVGSIVRYALVRRRGAARAVAFRVRSR